MGLDFLGALGKGVMIGADQIRQQEAHQAGLDRQAEASRQRDAFLKIQEAQLGIQKDQHQWKADAVKRQEAERERVDLYGKLRQGVAQHYKDLPDYAQEELVMDKWISLGHATPDEMALSKKTVDTLYQNFGADAVDKAIYGKDVSALDQVIRRQMPNAKLAFDGKTFTIDNGGQVTQVDRSGLLSTFALSKAQERMAARQSANLEAQETQSKILKNTAEAGRASRQYQDEVTQNPDGTITVVPGGGGRGRARTGRQSDVTDGRSPFGDVKGHAETQKLFMDAIDEQGLPYTAADGSAATLPRADALRRAMYHAEKLYDTNPQLSLEGARDAALRATVAEAGGKVEGGDYVPRLQMNPKTGQMEAKILTADGMELNYPTAALQADPVQVYHAELKWAEPMIASGEARAIAERLKEPESRNKVARAFADPKVAAALEQQSPGMLRKIEVLYAHNALPGVVLPAARLEQARARAQAVAQQQREALKLGRNQPAPAARQEGFSAEERARAAKLGAKPPIDLGEVATDAAQVVADTVSSGLAKMADHDFRVSAENLRRSEFSDRGAAQYLLGRIEKTPTLAEAFSDDELWAMQVLAGSRLSR